MTSGQRPELSIAELWRYPVKSLQGERLDAATVTADGILGDRHWGLLDRSTGLTLTARRVPDLLFAHARLSATGDVEIELPDGTVTSDDTVLSAWLGREVELRAADNEPAPATYEIDLNDDGRAGAVDDTNWVRWQGPATTFHDSTRTRVSLVSQATLGSWDRRRFRANVVLDGDAEPGCEDGYVGGQVAIGTAVLDVVEAIDRCVMVTRPQPDGIARDLDVLTTIVRQRGNELGVGALVRTPGDARVGDVVRPLSGD